MATLSAERKQEIGEFLTRVASWLDGDRALQVLTLAKEITGSDPETAGQEALDELSTGYNVPEVASYQATPGNPFPPHQQTEDQPEEDDLLD